jgi:hypothetical protein
LVVVPSPPALSPKSFRERELLRFSLRPLWKMVNLPHIQIIALIAPLGLSAKRLGEREIWPVQPALPQEHFGGSKFG